MTEKTVQKEPGKKPAPSKKPKPQQEVVVQIPLSELHPFPDHPFQVREDASMQETAESVKEYGVLVPALARPREDGGYLVASFSIPLGIQHFAVSARYFEEGYLRRLKKRTETFFAMAAHDCFNSEWFWNTMCDLPVPDVEPFTITPDLRSSYVFARHPKQEKETVFVNRYFFEHVISFYIFDLMNGLQHGHAPSRCCGCGTYFLTTNGHMPKYCDGIAPQDPRMTCRQYGAMMRQKEQNKQHPVYRLFTTRTNTIRKHHQRGKISDELRNEALYVAESLRDKALMDNDYAANGYAKDMEQEALYEQAKQRLGREGRP